MKILFVTLLSTVGIIGGALLSTTVNQSNSKAQKLETITQSSPTPSNTITSTTQQTPTPQPSIQPPQAITQQPQTTVQQPPTDSQQTLNHAESYRQSGKCGNPLRIRSAPDENLTRETNVGAVDCNGYVLVAGEKVTINGYGCKGDYPVFVAVEVPPETEVLDPATDDEQPNNVQPRREGYAATCGLNLQSRAIKGMW